MKLFIPAPVASGNFKPDYPVELNPGHFAAASCVSAILIYGDYAVDVAQGIVGKNVGGVTRTVRADGRAGTFANTGHFEFPHNAAYNTTGGVTILSTANVTTGSVYNSFCTKAVSNGASNTPYDFNTDNAGTPLLLLTRASASTYVQWFGPATTLNKLQTYGFSCGSDLSAVPTFFVNGAATTGTLGTGSRTGAVTGNTAPLWVGRRQDGATQLRGSMGLLLIFNRAFTTAEYQSLVANPYQLLRPKQHGLYLVVGGGGAISLVLANMAHAQAADALALTQLNNLVAADAQHAQTADNVSLGTVYALVAQDGLHAHLADAVTLSQAGNLALADGLHAQAADALTLTQTHLLALVDGLQAQTADNAVLTQAHILALADALHAQAADNLSLSGALQLVLADALNAQTADTAALTQTHLLALADALHGQSADNLSLSGAVQLILGDSLHAQAADSITLTQAQLLALADALHTHTADSITLSPGYTLAIADAVHATLANTLALTQQHVLIVSDALHAMLLDTAFFSTIPTPDSRVLIVRGENRVLIVAREQRVLIVAREQRVLTLH
jgi:hypothetical protein